jgi:hypothetical protein
MRIRTVINALKEQLPLQLLSELSDVLPPQGRRVLALFIAQSHCDRALEVNNSWNAA